jgi:type I restriction enzyme S subunit
MEAIMTKIDLNNLDRSTWETFTFEEIASKVSETVDPNKTELGLYIGLEHIDAEDIHIRRTGTPDDVNGQKLKCYPGDVIFGKRRAYQRKAAIVDFEGICSAHAFVLRANPDVIDPKLFTFFLHSDQFMHRAVDISVGGLSPTINWGDLKHQEFQLPPKDQQTQLAELLWAMDEVIEREKELLIKIDQFLHIKMIELLNGYNLVSDKTKLPNGWTIKKISELGKLNTSSVDKKIIENDKMINLVNYMDVYSSMDKKIDNRIDFMRVTANENQLIKNQLKKGDVLFTPSSETSDDIGHSAVVYEDLEDTLHSYHLVRLSFQDEIDLNFKRFIFNNPSVLYNFAILSKGVTRMTLSLDDFNNTEVRIPTIEEQKNIANKLSEILENKFSLDDKIKSSQSLQKSLINQVF